MSDILKMKSHHANDALIRKVYVLMNTRLGLGLLQLIQKFN